MIEEACRNTGMPPLYICISGKEKYYKERILISLGFFA